MRSDTVLLIVSAALVLLTAACDLAPSQPPVDPAAIGLQSGDLPSTFQRCRPSGDLDAYLGFLKHRIRAAHEAAGYCQARLEGIEPHALLSGVCGLARR